MELSINRDHLPQLPKRMRRQIQERGGNVILE
jgi:hypothetical protein